MTRAVRERVWNVLSEWFFELGGTSILMTWRDSSMPGGQRIAVLGSTTCELYQYDGVYLARRVPQESEAAAENSGDQNTHDT